jgi:hypothetical protein
MSHRKRSQELFSRKPKRKPAPTLAESAHKFILHVFDNPNHYLKFAQTLTGSPTHPGIYMLLVSCPDEMVIELDQVLKEVVDQAFQARGTQALKVQ